MARPKRTFSEEDVKKIEEMASNGLTTEQIGHTFGLKYDMFNKYVQTNESIKSVILKGRAKALNTVAETLYKKAVAGDNVCILFYLKCRGGWKDTQSIEFQDKTQPKELSDEQKSELAKQALRAMNKAQ